MNQPVFQGFGDFLINFETVEEIEFKYEDGERLLVLYYVSGRKATYTKEASDRILASMLNKHDGRI